MTTAHLAVLSSAECAHVAETVGSLREHWRQRRPFRPFHTLGTASYLDGKDSPDDYLRRTRRSNPILAAHFRPLYAHVCRALSDHLACPVVVDERLSLPGFHVIGFHPDFMGPVASMHYDLQYQLIPWAIVDDAPVSRPISFTLPVALPPAGAGLRVWNVRWEEVRDVDDSDDDRVRADAFRYVSYALGELVLHSGHQLHQIAPFAFGEPGDERVTLQGHGVEIGGKYVLYW